MISLIAEPLARLSRPELGSAWIEELLAPPSLDSSWLLAGPGAQSGEEQDVEARLAIGNGAFGMRASLGQSLLAARPGTFIAGLFAISDREPRIPALVAAPDWLRLGLAVDGELVALEQGQTLAYWRALDLQRGVLLREWHQRTGGGRIVRMVELRLASLANRHLGVQLVQIEVAQPCAITLAAAIQPTPGLQLVTSMPGLLVWSTPTGSAELAVASAVELLPPNKARPPAGLHPEPWTWSAAPGQARTLARLTAVAFSEASAPNPTQRAQAALLRARRQGLGGVVASHVAAWAKRWAASDVEVGGEEAAQRALRFAIYHLTSAANPDDEHVSVGARALTGEGYGGHVFWDTEIFLLPFYTLTWPAAARSMLMYRFHTLSAARAKAARLGFRGALYAWESAATGDEATPPWAVSRDGQVVPILCGTQEQHISADVAYAVWQYWQATRDVAFLLNAGAEILLETARFWASRAVLESDGVYHIRGVIGPDEYHESVDDNAYTNRMAAWNLDRGLTVASLVRARWPTRWTGLSRKLELDESELSQWREVSLRVATGFDSGSGLFEQFTGFFRLEDVDLRGYADRGAPLDVVLGADRTRRSQVIKQADVLMLPVLFPGEFERRVLENNFRYYEPRCGHGSSLSPAIHALLAARLGDTRLAERYFRQAASIDLDDARGDTALGVHIAAQGGLWQAAVFGFGGLRLGEHDLRLDPHLPLGWDRLAFRIRWRGRSLRFEVQPAQVSACLKHGRPLRITVGADSRRLSTGTTLIWDSRKEASRHGG